MIRVYDTKQEQDIYAPIVLTTINCDGVYRYWNADNMDELHRWWWYEDYTGPASDDEVVGFIINNGIIRSDMKALNTAIRVFEDIVKFYGFDEEVEVEASEFIS